jgi:UDP-N-acetylglucosamine 2-epimerase (non-hydrolysing)
LLHDLPAIWVAEKPDIVLAQGDTTSVMATALACFYSGICFGHVEAGLRTGDLQNPFPEEFNRYMAARIATLSFAPTAAARDNLLREGLDPTTIILTGNTVIDALHWSLANGVNPDVSGPDGRRIMLVTLHRRESLGPPLTRILAAIRKLAARNQDLRVIYPLHPNPLAARPAREALQAMSGVQLCQPLDYPALVAILQHSYLVLTDSGGLQEEASALGIPVLVARQTTERPEVLDLGVGRLVGTDTEPIVAAVQELLDDESAHQSMARVVSPFGDGRASVRICDALMRWKDTTQRGPGLLSIQ